MLTKFKDVYAITKKLEKKEKGDYFEKFTKCLFLNCPVFLYGLDKIWLYDDIPEKILEELKYPRKDMGIDLLAIINGEYVAIQCKFSQDPYVVIPWAKLSTFFGLSFGITDKIKKGYLVTNTYNLHNFVVVSEKIMAIDGNYLKYNLDDFFPIPQNFSKPKKNYITKNPRKYQKKCRKLATEHFIENNNKRGQITMACGSGKTLTSYWIYKKICTKQNSLCVIFVPSLYLLSQFNIDWKYQSHSQNDLINYILIGSDADVDEVKDISNETFLLQNPDEIRKHLNNITTNTVVICTYQSADKLAEACGRDIKFDFGIFDEAHKTVGQKNKQFSLMLNNKNLIIKKRLFMTATPKLAKENNIECVGMNNEETYGKCFYNYGIRQAIIEKHLTDYRILTLYTDNDMIKSNIADNDFVKYKNKFEDIGAKYIATALTILKQIHQKEALFDHLVTYHNTVAKSKKFVKLLKTLNKILYDDDDILITSISGSDSMRTRKKIINEFNEYHKAILCSARVLNEGINIPIINAVCFVDCRKSTSDIIQCIGRALRLYPGKTMAYIIIPIFIDDLDDSNNVLKILKSLIDCDSAVADYFTLRISENSNSKTNTNANVIIEEDFLISSKKINIKKWNEKINSNIWKIINKKNCNEFKEPVKLFSSKLIREIGMFLPTNDNFSKIKKLSDTFKIFDYLASKNNQLYAFKIISRSKYSGNGKLNTSYNLISSTDNYKREIKLFEKKCLDNINYCFIIVAFEEEFDCIYYWGKYTDLDQEYTMKNILDGTIKRISIKTSPLNLKKYKIFGNHKWTSIQNKYSDRL